MRVRRSRKRNSFFDRELNDAIGGIKLVHGLAPTGSGKFDGKIARANEIDGLVDNRTNLRVRAVTVDLDKIEMRQAINQTARGDFAHAPKIIGIEIVDVAPFELRCAGWNAVEHLRRIIEVMDRAENEIELVPILFDPLSSGGRCLRIVVELDAGPDLHIGIRCAQLVDFIEIDSGMETIVIGKRDVVQTTCARAVDPRLQQFSRIQLNSMSLRMGMIIRKKSQR